MESFFLSNGFVAECRETLSLFMQLPAELVQAGGQQAP